MNRSEIGLWRFSEPPALSQTEIVKSITTDDLLSQINEFRQEIEDLEETVEKYISKNSTYDNLREVKELLVQVHLSASQLKTKFAIEHQKHTDAIAHHLTTKP